MEKEWGNKRRRAKRLRKAEVMRLANLLFSALLSPSAALRLSNSFPSSYEMTPSSRPTLVKAAMA